MFHDFFLYLIIQIVYELSGQPSYGRICSVVSPQKKKKKKKKKKKLDFVQTFNR